MGNRILTMSKRTEPECDPEMDNKLGCFERIESSKPDTKTDQEPARNFNEDGEQIFDPENPDPQFSLLDNVKTQETLPETLKPLSINNSGVSFRVSFSLCIRNFSLVISN